MSEHSNLVARVVDVVWHDDVGAQSLRTRRAHGGARVVAQRPKMRDLVHWARGYESAHASDLHWPEPRAIAARQVVLTRGSRLPDTDTTWVLARLLVTPQCAIHVAPEHAEVRRAHAVVYERLYSARVGGSTLGTRKRGENLAALVDERHVLLEHLLRPVGGCVRGRVGVGLER